MGGCRLRKRRDAVRKALHPCVKGGATLLGIRSVMEDWGVDVGPTLRLRTDSSAAQGFARRRGLGRQRLVSTRFLWLQGKVSRGELRITDVDTEDQLADCLTKPTFLAEWMDSKASQLGLKFRKGR